MQEHESVRRQTVEGIMQAWQDFRGRIPADATRLRWFAFDRIAGGKPATLRDAEQELGMTSSQVAAATETMTRWGLMTVNAHGTMTGSMGLTVESTEYDFVLNGRSLHTWCALDAVGIAAGLGADAKITVPGLAKVEVRAGRVTEMEPSDLRISLPHPQLDRSIRETVCPTICFRRGPGPAHEGVAYLTLEEAAALGRQLWSR